jgi:hypothetical protein
MSTSNGGAAIENGGSGSEICPNCEKTIKEMTSTSKNAQMLMDFYEKSEKVYEVRNTIVKRRP